MKGLVWFVAFCFVGTLIGLITAQHAVSGRYGVVAETKGAWTVWPRAASSRIDPYTRAHHLSYGLVPSNRFDTVEYEAQVDDVGRPLQANCTYLVSGSNPDARWWSVSAVAPDDEAQAPSEPRQGLVSGQIVFEPDQSFRIAVSPELQAGNWLRPPESGDLVLLLRLYTPASAVLRNPLTTDLPSIERQVCR
ncbi:MAG: DUF1214 domain-containing protein [Hyphomicrobiales bacterium]